MIFIILSYLDIVQDFNSVDVVLPTAFIAVLFMINVLIYERVINM